jgi:hypothetical protein
MKKKKREKKEIAKKSLPLSAYSSGIQCQQVMEPACFFHGTGAGAYRTD